MEVMSAELQHPGLFAARRSENSESIKSVTVVVGRAAFRQLLVGIHNVDDFLVAIGTENRLQHFQSGGALSVVQAAERDSGTRHVARGKIRPDGIAVFLPDENSPPVLSSPKLGSGRCAFRREGKQHLSALVWV